MTLTNKKKGEAAIVKSIGKHQLTSRLHEIGIFPGAVIRIKHIAPLGDPIAIQVASYTFALRKAIADLIEIED